MHCHKHPKQTELDSNIVLLGCSLLSPRWKKDEGVTRDKHYTVKNYEYIMRSASSPRPEIKDLSYSTPPLCSAM